MDIQALFVALQKAYETVKAKELVKEETGAAYHAATQDLATAVDQLNEYRAQLNDVLGNVTNDPRVRMG